MLQRPILVVDDEAEMRMAVSDALARQGHDVSTAVNGADGLEKFSNRNYDLVITDMKMPNMGGIDLLRKVKKVSPGTPVVVITAFGTIESAVEAMKIGADDYLMKPFSIEDLEHVVFHALKRERSTRPVGSKDGFHMVSPSHGIISEDPRMLRILRLSESVAQSGATVLIQGESGTGKELIARFIHDMGPRKKRPFIAVNCAAIPQGLLESELFGHERGAFTGAMEQQVGKFELANHGTILLDEVSEMDKGLQAKLLRVLQEHEIDRVGGNKPIPVEIRVLATTNTSLRKLVEEGKFREDLFFRLNVIPLVVPPLRERNGDIEILTDFFLEKFRKENGREGLDLSAEALSALKRHEWKGNVRELKNILERAVLIAEGEVIKPADLFAPEGDAAGPIVPLQTGLTMREMEKELILKTLEEKNQNRTHTAKVLGISLRTLRNKIKEYAEETNGQNLPT